MENWALESTSAWGWPRWFSLVNPNDKELAGPWCSRGCCCDCETNVMPIHKKWAERIVTACTCEVLPVLHLVDVGKNRMYIQCKFFPNLKCWRYGLVFLNIWVTCRKRRYVLCGMWKAWTSVRMENCRPCTWTSRRRHIRTRLQDIRHVNSRQQWCSRCKST